MGPGRERGVDGSCQLICDWLADGLITSIMMHTSRYSAQVSSLNDCCLIPTHIYSTRPWSFHCPRVGCDSGSTFDHWRSRSRNIPIQGHHVWAWVLLCTLLAGVRGTETIVAMNRTPSGGGRRVRGHTRYVTRFCPLHYDHDTILAQNVEQTIDACNIPKGCTSRERGASNHVA